VNIIHVDLDTIPKETDMQIKDLTVEAELAEVRGGVGDVTGTILDQSYNKNDSDIDFRGGATTLSGGIAVSQLLDARKKQSLEMPVYESSRSLFSVDISDSAFNFGW
jgi:hypothetical protein